jgi:hypothetical protein
MTVRRQLPVYSPVSAAAIRRAAVSGFAPGTHGQAGFRAVLERDYSADTAVLLASGTQALQVALELALRHLGETRVALPAFTCFDVASAAVGARARMHFYDLDPETLAPDLESLRHVLERGVRVVVISPLYGYPVDWRAVEDLLAGYGAIAVEDAAQGWNAEWQGAPLGSLGPISVLSFGRGKGWTGGRGGALLIRDQPRLRGLGESLHGWPQGRPRRTAEAGVLTVLAAQWALARPEWYGIPHAIPWLRLGETVYHEPTAPRPMTRAATACLAASRVAAAREGTTRRALAESFLLEVGSGRRVRPIQPLHGARPGYLRLPLRLAGGGVDDRAARLGLAPSYPSVLAAIPQVRAWVDDTSGRWPGARELVRTLFTVPTHSRVTAEEREALLQLLWSYEAQV